MFLPTIKSSCNASARASVIGAQISPRPSLAIKFTTSGLALAAAVMKSPSFSLSSSSTTMTNLPALIASMADSTVSNFLSSLALLIAHSFCWFPYSLAPAQYKIKRSTKYSHIHNYEVAKSLKKFRTSMK